MSAFSASPYINFQGQAREAMAFYQKALGGKLDMLTENNQGPPKEAGPLDHIMHSALQNEGLLIMGSDGRPEYPPTVGDNIAITLTGEDAEYLINAFNLLSEGGDVKQPLKIESWGDSFGYFTDKFGINWMVNIITPKS